MTMTVLLCHEVRLTISQDKAGGHVSVISTQLSRHRTGQQGGNPSFQASGRPSMSDLGAASENANISIEAKRCITAAGQRLQKYSCWIYDRPNAQLLLKT